MPPAVLSTAFCSLLSHTKPPGTALGRSPAHFFARGAFCSCCLFPPLPPHTHSLSSAPTICSPDLQQQQRQQRRRLWRGGKCFVCSLFPSALPCMPLLDSPPQAANSKRARKGGTLSRTDLIAAEHHQIPVPTSHHLTLILQHPFVLTSQQHLAPISQHLMATSQQHLASISHHRHVPISQNPAPSLADLTASRTDCNFPTSFGTDLISRADLAAPEHAPSYADDS